MTMRNRKNKTFVPHCYMGIKEAMARIERIFISRKYKAILLRIDPAEAIKEPLYASAIETLLYYRYTFSHIEPVHSNRID